MAATRIMVYFIGLPISEQHSNYFSVTDEQHFGTLFLWITKLISFPFQSPLIPSIVLSSLLVFIQAFSLNSILFRSKALTQNTYLPAACYVLILSASPEFMLISPALFAITFILIGINYMLFHLQYRGSEENILSTGFVFGLASLFDPSSALLILVLFIVYIFYSNTLNRRYLLLVFGVVFPYLLVWLYFFLIGEGSEFWIQTAQNIFILDAEFIIPLDQLAIMMAFPLLISVVSAGQTFTGSGLTVHQIVTQKTFLLLSLFAIGSFFLNGKVSSNSFVYMAPTMAFFISQFLLTRERKWVPEVVFLLLLLWSLAFLVLPIVAPNIFSFE